MKLRRYLSLLLGASLLIGILSVACGTQSNGPVVQEANPGTDVKSEEPAGPLVVYSGRSEKLVGSIIDTFEMITGIEVEVRYGKTAGLAATILEEGDNTPADVFYGQDPAGLGAIASVLRPMPEEILALVDSAFRSANGTWVGVTGRARVVAYNTDALTPDQLPGNINGFTEPEWRGRLGWAPTNGSFQTMVTAMRVVWGEEATRSWLLGIMANDVQEYPKNTPIIAALGTGEIDVGLVNHYYLYRFLAEKGETFPVRNHFMPGAGPESLLMVSGIGVLNNSDNVAAAEQFVSFMISSLAQRYFANETYEYPLIRGIEPYEGLAALEDLQFPQVDITNMNDLEGTLDLLREVGALP